MFDHPQVLAEEIMATIPHESLGSYRGVAKPINFSRTPSAAPFAAPSHGQDSDRLCGGSKIAPPS
jgi:formyl-CoA transferase